ncbi:TetR/AcrR family transcriptional regulator [Microbacterium sp. W1N]|uniref:TetR/AcrR family transcriptional regulator n=1 Tax=Microbacterium festucae TaxID=2977531 RepID=UPI0021BFAB08|nr:TetR/AcrR family transcriptional regulator [Microbacterium festucae]MCT9820036.1 TetR/AcrR family transcriptional regulator [Microbacterium festucae]
MIESATASPRERRRVETTRTLVSLTRRATAAHGLAGFTIEEICAQAGVSRRTFFNYFASKEDAVLGVPLGADSADEDEFFVAMRPRTPAGQLSHNLVDDFATLIAARWAKLDIDRASAAELMAAAEREPQLLPHMLERGRLDQQKDIALIERREQLQPGDPRAAVLVQIIVHLGHLALPLSLDPDDPEPFPAALQRLVATASALFSSHDRHRLPNPHDPESAA